ncbi:hypothetical protein F1C16_03115 [Hymenobacter sp. NBH84]|uniref:hypothetical protein n=1 Tax=Hymenobacter sp. NBH84 TaxID=2596915 RepID=UPI0016242966|nr:hypothetical protein [Hymenobacter sp. NBH84]QNE38613.1 hypothetical protein F1C16_03115 [Hymenobacter sp. NBH84]
MEQELLLATSNVKAYYDHANNWLYLDWHGEITLNSVRSNCLQLARCFLIRRYKRILNDNTNVAKVTPEVAPWLANEFLPHLRLLGIEYVAWICSPDMHIQNDTEIALEKLTSPVVALFDDMATAYEWLSIAKFQSPVMLNSPQSFTQIMTALKERISSLGGTA